MSTQTQNTVDPLTLRKFREWEPRFNATLESPGPKAAWNFLLERYCIWEDLVWGLYWAVDSMNTSTKFPEAVTVFQEARASVLRDTTRLKADLARVMNLRFEGIPTWILLAQFCDAEVKRAGAHFFLFQKVVPGVEQGLKGIKLPRLSKAVRSVMACHGEVWLQAYVKSATHRLYRAQMSVLLEAAADAYGGLERFVFTEDAVNQRYVRYRRDYPKQYEHVLSWLEELWSERLNGNEVELIPFLLERSISGAAISQLKPK